MGLVLTAPADLLVPLADTPQVAPAQSSPDAGLFASLLASLSAMVEGDATGQAVTTNTIPDNLPAEEEPAEKQDTEPFAALMAMTVAIPVTPRDAASDPSVQASSKPAEQISEAAGHGHGRVQADVKDELANELPAAFETASTNAAPTGTETPTGTEGLTDDAVPEMAPQPSPAATEAAPSASTPLATEISTEIATEGAIAGRISQPVRPDNKESIVATPLDAPPPTEASSTNVTPGVVRSVGNVESSELGKKDGSGKDNRGEHNGRSTEGSQGLPRASANGVLHAADGSAVAQLRSTDTVAPADGAAPLPADPTGVTDVPPQVEQVAQTVIESVEAGGGEARIHLDPAGLGEVTIHVRTELDHVRVEIRAERHEAMQLLRDHTQDLSNLLGERGLNLSDVNVGLGRGSGDQAWGREDNRQKNNLGNEFASILGIDEPAVLETHNRLRAAYNPDGALVYRV